MRAIGSLFALLFLAGLVLKYIWWIALVAAVIGGHKLFVKWQGEHRAEIAAHRARQAEIVARADQQHAWIMADDQRGIYGAYPPAAI